VARLAASPGFMSIGLGLSKSTHSFDNLYRKVQTMKLLLRFTLIVTLLVLGQIPAAALEIEEGIDLWWTRGDGSTFASFAREPIPAGFFCAGSAPFTGQIEFRGVPVATDPPGLLGRADTVLHRLDDVVFDESGVAVTRLQMRAMQFEALRPLRTECGTFRVAVELDGEQPITEMRIIRETARGGRFLADIHVNIRISFTPEDHGGDTVSVSRQLRLNPAPNAVWSDRPDRGYLEVDGSVRIDTNADGLADTFVPGTSRAFFAGSRTAFRRSGVLQRADSSYFGKQRDQLPSPPTGARGAVEGPSQSADAGLGTQAAASEEVYCHLSDNGHTHCSDGTVKTGTE